MNRNILTCLNLRKGNDHTIYYFYLFPEYDLVGREDKIKALDGITLQEDTEFYPIKEGEFVIIRGPSGGGKTTLLNMFGTIDTISGG